MRFDSSIAEVCFWTSRWPIGVMFAAHCTIVPLHNLAASQNGHFINLPLHKPTASKSYITGSVYIHVRVWPPHAIISMDGARAYTSQVTRLYTSIVLHECSSALQREVVPPQGHPLFSPLKLSLHLLSPLPRHSLRQRNWTTSLAVRM